jgi:hypothetical protein
MARTRTVAVTLAVSAGLAVVPATSAFAAGTTTCDAYSHKCTQVLGTKFHKPVIGPNDGSLPFTGAEIAGMVVVGGAALVGGTGIALAGRRRRLSPA